MAAAEQRICVFDTTLRDGEQSPGVSMTPGEKLMAIVREETLRAKETRTLVDATTAKTAT
jgi:hypothetical protein